MCRGNCSAQSVCVCVCVRACVRVCVCVCVCVDKDAHHFLVLQITLNTETVICLKKREFQLVSCQIKYI